MTSYLDHNANSPMTDAAVAAFTEAAAAGGSNPSSGHSRGLRSCDLLEEARRTVARSLGARPSEILFTSGGTESNNLALRGLLEARAPRKRIVTVATEHHSVIETAEALAKKGFEAVVLPVDGDGLIDLDRLVSHLDDDTALVAVMLANNETGTIQDVAAIARECHARGVPFHTDMVQAVGKIPIDLHALNPSTAALTAHKIGGPIGVGALYVSKGTSLAPQSFGGGQERHLRPGTPPFALAHSFAVALSDAVDRLDEMNGRVRALRDRLEVTLAERIPGLLVNGAGAERLPNTSLLTFPSTDAAALMFALDEAGIQVGTGAACGTHDRTPSHVLTAMGRSPEQAQGSLRLSLFTSTSQLEVSEAIERLLSLVPAPLRNP
jgi:cysteine desulfurase